MTGPETLDVARDAIWTIIVVSSPLMIVGLRGRRRGVAVSGVDADPGTDPGVRAKDFGDLRDPVAGIAIHGGLTARADDADIVANHRRLMALCVRNARRY